MLGVILFIYAANEFGLIAISEFQKLSLSKRELSLCFKACKKVFVKMSIICMKIIKKGFRINGFAFSYTLKQRLNAIQLGNGPL